MQILNAGFYYNDEYRMSYFCNKNGQEIDLIIQRPAKETLLIEIKSSDNVQSEQLKTLEKWEDEFPQAIRLCFSRDKKKKIFPNVTFY